MGCMSPIVAENRYLCNHSGPLMVVTVPNSCCMSRTYQDAAPSTTSIKTSDRPISTQFLILESCRLCQSWLGAFSRSRLVSVTIIQAARSWEYSVPSIQSSMGRPQKSTIARVRSAHVEYWKPTRDQLASVRLRGLHNDGRKNKSPFDRSLNGSCLLGSIIRICTLTEYNPLCFKVTATS